MANPALSPSPSPFARRLPLWKRLPYPEPNILAVVSLDLVFAAIGVLAAYLPRKAPLDVTLPLLEVALAVSVVAVVLLVARRTFPWRAFRAVAVPAFLAVAAAGAVIEFVFLYDRTYGWSLAILTAGVVLIALNLPLLLAYSVARHVAIPDVVTLDADETPYRPFGT